MDARTRSLFGKRGPDPEVTDRRSKTGTVPPGVGPVEDPLRTTVVRLMLVRAGAAPLALLQALFYTGRYPSGARSLAIALALSILIGDLLVWLAYRQARDRTDIVLVAAGSIAVDLIFTAAYCAIFAFDPSFAVWLGLFLVPIEGAMFFALRGALVTWLVACGAYIARDAWASAHYGIDLEWSRIALRILLGFVIAVATGVLARDLIRQRKRVEAALADLTRIDSLRSALVSTLAHDLRNPLTAIRGAHRTLMSRPTDPAHTAELLEIADRHSRRLQRLAIDLLDLARLEGGRLDLETESVGVVDAIEAALTYVESGDLFETPGARDLSVRVDPERFQQIIVNLADNAVRYGAPPFAIDTVASGSTVEIIFSDHGPGLPEAIRDSIFEAFAARREVGSVGFGLAIVRGLAEAHGGNVRYEDNEPSGSRFVLRLPAG